MICLTLVVLSLSGCAEAIARRVTAAPNAQWASQLPWQTTVPATLGMSLAEHVSVRRIAVASGAVSLRAVILEPSAAPWQLATVNGGEQWQHAWSPSPVLPALGTIVILHGLKSSSDYTTAHAVGLVNAGFRCVLIDLRGHGESTGTTMSFGKSEAADLRQALSNLQQTGTIQPPLILLGYSLGGSVALMAATEPTPVTAVVAVAPFAHLADVAPNFANYFGGWLTWFVTDGLTRNTIAAIGRDGDFDPSSDSPLAWAPRVQVPVLLIHGADDTLVPPEQSAQLAGALGGPVTRIVLPGQEHILAVLEASFTIPTILPWLESYVGGAYRTVDGPMLGWAGDADSATRPLSATWARRENRIDSCHAWPRPVGGRNVRTWARLPAAWIGRDLTLDLGTIDGADETWCGAARIGGYPALPSTFPAVYRRYPIAGWMTTSNLEITTHLVTTSEDAGVHLAATGVALLRLRNDLNLPQGKNKGESQP